MEIVIHDTLVGKTLVREWARVRWGVFPEYNDDTGPHFYVNNGFIVPVRCVEKLAGFFLHKTTRRSCSFNSRTLEVSTKDSHTKFKTQK